VLAITVLGLAWGFQMHSMGWAQSAHFAEVRALAAGTPRIDRWHWEGMDKAWIDGHFYSVKAPGLAAVTLPAYLAIEKLGGLELAHDAAREARRAQVANWAPSKRWPYVNHGYSERRSMVTERRIESGAPVVWALTLVGAVLPAVGLLFAVRWVGDRIAPGYGAAAAITLGLATVVMTFAAEYFSHVIAAACGFGAFALLFAERRGPPRTVAMAGAGLLAGLAVTFEYPLGLVGLIVLAYGLSRGPRPRRAAAYGAGALVGMLPVLLFNLWAFGDPLRLAYGDAVAVQGMTGHALVGLNDGGFFGIGAPQLGAAIDLLFAGRGLLVLTPVLAAALLGAVLMRREGHRAEANVILAVAVAYFIYNAGYWQPFGGGTPGPRFLVPTLPFLALGLAVAYRRRPALTLGLAIPSAVCMLAAALTYPLVGEQGVDTWVHQLAAGDIEHTVLTVLGVRENWLAALPFVVAVIAAAVFAARSVPPVAIGPLRAPASAVLVWALVASLGPTIAADPTAPLSGDAATLWLVAAGAATSLAILGWLRYREVRKEPASPAVRSRDPALETGSIV
jgi:hypothetical protein